MKCKQCGSELKADSAFCPICGRKIDVMDIKIDSVKRSAEDISAKSKEKISKMNKKQKTLLVSLCSLAAVIVITGICLMSYFNSPTQKIIKAIENGDSYYAQEMYSERISDNLSKRESFVKAVKKYIESLTDDFQNDKCDYSYATQRLEIISNFRIQDLNDACSNAGSQINRLNNSKTAFEQAESFYNNKDYKSAIGKYRLVIEEDKNYGDAQDKIKDATKKYTTAALESAQSYADGGNYSSAIAEIKEALAVVGEDTELNNMLNKYTENNKSSVISNAISQADKYASSGDYQNAVKVLSEAMSTVEPDSQVKTKFSEYSVKYSQSVSQKADELINGKKYDEAISLLDDALALMPDDASLKAKLSTAQDKKPVSLSETTLVNQKEWKWNDGSPVDTFGNDYSGAANYIIPYYQSYGEFRVYKKYKTLSGYIAPHKEKYDSDSGPWYIQIFADDKLVYTSKNVTRKTDKFAFNVNVANADYIKIVIYGESYSYNHGIILSDLMLNK